VIGREIEKSTQGIYPLQNVCRLHSLHSDEHFANDIRSTFARSSF
jgi:ribosomal protein S3AE